jgi:hypothetical protein
VILRGPTKDILTEIERAADLEADQIDEDIRYAANEDIIQYTDPAGNTFEAIDFHNAVTTDPEEEADEELTVWTEQHIITKDEESFQIDENQEWTGENASNMSLGLSPADYEMMEAIESSVGTPIEADLDNVPTEKKEEIVDNSFDLDFELDNVEETDDNTPDFF